MTIEELEQLHEKAERLKRMLAFVERAQQDIAKGASLRVAVLDKDNRVTAGVTLDGDTTAEIISAVNSASVDLQWYLNSKGIYL